MRQLRESLLEELNSKNMLETIGTFNHLFRYSGTTEGEAAVSYLEEKLSEYGIPFEHCSMRLFQHPWCGHSAEG